MEKLKNDVSIGELSDLLACLDRTQDNLKQVISNRKRGYTDNVKENSHVLIYKICRESEIQAEQEKQRQAANMYRPTTPLCSGKMREMHGMQETKAAGMGHTAFGRSPQRKRIHFRYIDNK